MVEKEKACRSTHGKFLWVGLTIPTHIPLARIQSHGHTYLQGKLGNTACTGNPAQREENVGFAEQKSLS